SIIASYKKAYDLISIGAYKEGSDPKVDHAVKTIDRINNYLRQDMGDKTDFDDSVQALFSLAV
ncbi:MAG: flagellum-specific ATP synthase FliI, partial [Deltaproteobacteria bacterium]|nr:flagellum-specific ATP synthase FliI [Deltaproteobacteria bacterium]